MHFHLAHSDLPLLEIQFLDFFFFGNPKTPIENPIFCLFLI